MFENKSVNGGDIKIKQKQIYSGYLRILFIAVTTA